MRNAFEILDELEDWIAPYAEDGRDGHIAAVLMGEMREARIEVAVYDDGTIATGVYPLPRAPEWDTWDQW